MGEQSPRKRQAIPLSGNEWRGRKGGEGERREMGRRRRRASTIVIPSCVRCLSSASIIHGCRPATKLPRSPTWRICRRYDTLMFPRIEYVRSGPTTCRAPWLAAMAVSGMLMKPIARSAAAADQSGGACGTDGAGHAVGIAQPHRRYRRDPGHPRPAVAAQLGPEDERHASMYSPHPPDPHTSSQPFAWTHNHRSAYDSIGMYKMRPRNTHLRINHYSLPCSPLSWPPSPSHFY